MRSTTRMLALAAPAIERGERVELEMTIANTNRAVGTMLSHRISQRWGGDGLPDDTIHVKFHGSAGQSFGAFLARGITLELKATPTTTSARACPAGASSCIRRPKARSR